MEKLYSILEDVRPDVDFHTIKNLVTYKYIDSFDIVTIISYLEDEYGIEIPVEEMLPENFESAEAIMALVKSVMGGND